MVYAVYLYLYRTIAAYTHEYGRSLCSSENIIKEKQYIQIRREYTYPTCHSSAVYTVQWA